MGGWDSPPACPGESSAAPWIYLLLLLTSRTTQRIIHCVHYPYHGDAMTKLCFSCNPTLVPDLDQITNQMFFCGGEAICVCDTIDPDTLCPNCGGTAYPCPCGGDETLPSDKDMWDYYYSELGGSD